jgi:beta-N-acetylhexosaminidase
VPPLALVPAFAALALPAPAQPAGDAIATLPLRELAGQRIVVGYEGPEAPPWLLARVRAGEVGGVIVYTRNIVSRAALAGQLRVLQRVPRPVGAPLLTLIDQEGGRVARLPGAPAGSAAAMAPRGIAYVRRQGRLTAANLRAAGVNVDLAPVVDLGRSGSYEVIYERTFGRAPSAVGSLGAAFARGLRDGGVAATLKQFPGLGGVRGNTDEGIQRVTLSRAALRRTDEAPFATGMRAGAQLVMTSSAIYPALDPRHPALLSRAITTGELRGRLGFTGVALTDDLDAGSPRAIAGPGPLAVTATAAGNDLLLFAHDPARSQAGLDAVVAAVRSGRLSRAALVASVRRVLALRATLRAR